MKKLFAILNFALLSAAAAQTGPFGPYGPYAETYSSDQPALADHSTNIINPDTHLSQADQSGNMIDPGCPCYNGRFELGAFVGGLFPTGDDSDSDGEALETSGGGGITVGYWFTPKLGLEYSAALYHNEFTIHNSALDVVLRFPERFQCFAPYVFAGGGFQSGDSSGGLYRVGAGLDVRLVSWDCVGWFIDGAYTFAEDSTSDYAIARIGVKIPF